LRIIDAIFVVSAQGPVIMQGNAQIPLFDTKGQRRRQRCAVCGCADCKGVRNLCCDCLETAIAVLELFASDDRQTRPACAPALAILEHQLR
jgi:hypothetical protein